MIIIYFTHLKAHSSTHVLHFTDVLIYDSWCCRADKAVMASSGFQADVKALQKVLAARHLVRLLPKWICLLRLISAIHISQMLCHKLNFHDFELCDCGLLISTWRFIPLMRLLFVILISFFVGKLVLGLDYCICIMYYPSYCCCCIP